MFSVALLYLVAVICSATWTHALPLYPETNLDPQPDVIHNPKIEEEIASTDFIQKLVSEVEDGANTAEGEQREVFPLLMLHNGGRDSWNKGEKDSAQQEKFVNLVEDFKDVVLKLAAADKLRSQGFVRSEQSLPKTNKRACFWKYCVTN